MPVGKNGDGRDGAIVIVDVFDVAVATTEIHPVVVNPIGQASTWEGGQSGDQDGSNHNGVASNHNGAGSSHTHHIHIHRHPLGSSESATLKPTLYYR